MYSHNVHGCSNSKSDTPGTKMYRRKVQSCSDSKTDTQVPKYTATTSMATVTVKLIPQYWNV